MPATSTPRVVLVTGASSGIGRATALAFAAEGAVVACVARRTDRLEETVAACRARAPDALAIAADLGVEGAAERVVAETLSRFGRLDVLVNNAALPLHRSVLRTEPEDVARVLRVNLESPIRATLAALPAMLRQRAGSIVNVSSFVARVVPPRESVYAASKAGLSAFSEGLWHDLAGSGVHVAIVHPGAIDTEMWQQRDDPGGYRGARLAAERVADAILDAVARRRFEVTVPRGSPRLVLARWLRLLAPGLLRAGMRRFDPTRPEEIAAARGETPER